MNILVTGSTGFIGSHLCKALAAEGHDVRAFHRASSPLSPLDGVKVTHVVGDLTKPETLLAAMKDVEVIFHTATMSGSSSRKLGRMYTVMVEGTRSLLQAARVTRVRRIIHTSSVAALGIPDMPETRAVHKKKAAESQEQGPPRWLMNENHTWHPKASFWHYAYTKYLAEMEVQRAVAQGVDVVILNPTLVMGAGDLHRQSSSLVVKVAQRRLPLVVEGGINVVHIKDVVAGHLAALSRGRRGERYILGGENLTIPQLVDKIAETIGMRMPVSVLPNGIARRLAGVLGLVSPFLDLPVSPVLLRLSGFSFYYAIRKSQSALQLPPPRPVEETIRDAYEWLKAIGALPQNHLQQETQTTKERE